MLLEPRNRILFIGDSITDCGRRRPIGQGMESGALGAGYVALVHAALLSGYADHGLEVLNMGVSGDTVSDLRSRWTSDVLALRPDWLSIFIGINDVWRRESRAEEPQTDGAAGEYEAALGDLIAATLPRLSGLILMTPYYLQPDRSDPMRQSMDAYGMAVHRLAALHGAVLVDTQAAFDRVMLWTRPADLAGDRVHVGGAGHMVLAQEVLDGLQFDGSRRPPNLRTPANGEWTADEGPTRMWEERLGHPPDDPAPRRPGEARDGV